MTVTVPHNLRMLSDNALELAFKKRNPHAQRPSLLDAASKRNFNVQQVPIEATLVRKIREQPRIMWRHGERPRSIRMSGAALGLRELPDEELEALRLAFLVLEYPVRGRAVSVARGGSGRHSQRPEHLDALAVCRSNPSRGWNRDTVVCKATRARLGYFRTCACWITAY